jgi:hypothetical protein
MANQTENNIPDLMKEFEKKCEEAITKGAFLVHGEVVETLSGKRSGFKYPVPGTGKVVNKEKELANGRVFHYRKLEGATYYRASAPGEPPAVRLGDLRTDYKAKVTGQGSKAVGLVGSRLDYSVYLEKGTSDMHPRPHLKPSFQAMEEEVQKLFEGLL